MRIAGDELLSKKAEEALERAGHEVVVLALGRPDDVWFAEAMDKKAQLIISGDDQVLARARIYGLLTIDPPAGLRGQKLTDFLLREVKK